MYKLKNMAKRSAAFTAAVAMFASVGSAALPAITFADALNPLTERSLMLSSSAPGWRFVDGSGNETYAPPGSGPNGQKTGETFSFRTTTASNASGDADNIKAFTLQYCAGPAGNCVAPGNIGLGPVGEESALNINYTGPTEGTDQTLANRGDFLVLTGETLAGAAVSTGWTMTTSRVVNSAGNNPAPNNNFITLTNETGLDTPASTKVWILFYADADNYITNPGAGTFFVRINTFNSDGDSDPTEINPHHANAKIIDGGVTVANMMNDSIWITTKVLETMAFSVGTSNPDTEELGVGQLHGTCSPITDNDMIQMGDPNSEYSLSPTDPYDEYSYWRLATNSSAGATVYYSGDTLRNTVGDHIKSVAEYNFDQGEARETNRESAPGSEQFGLALMTDYSRDGATDDTTSPALDTAHFPVGYSGPTLDPLAIIANYELGDGNIGKTGEDSGDPDAQFSFDEKSLLTPVAIATDNDDVLECATAKIRYIANIAAATPAGVYGTRINYIAAPMY